MQEALGLENEPLLLMGIGHSDETKSRRIHHTDPSFKFPTIKKSPIPVKIVK